MNKFCCSTICCVAACCGTRYMSKVWQRDGILCVWNFGTLWLGLRERVHGEPCWTWPSPSGVQLSCWFSSAETPQVDLLLLFLCKTWGDTNACLIMVKVRGLRHKRFFLLCCVTYCIWNVPFVPWWCGYLIHTAHQELSHCYWNNWSGFTGVTTEVFKGT